MRPDGGRGGGLYVLKTAERLSTSPHYCPRELSGKGGGRRRRQMGDTWGAMKGEQRQFSTRSPE